MCRQVLYAVLISAVLLPLTVARGQTGGGPPMPPARQVPGITAEDMFTNVCVDCHIIRPEIGLDVRLSSVMKRWEEQVDQKTLAIAQASAPMGVKLTGKHPAAGDAFRDIPSACLKCHGDTSKQAPPLSQMLHSLHLTGGDDNPFMTQFQAECTHCHKLNQATGAWSIPSGPEK